MAVTRTCVICGKYFQAKSSAITCSVECRKINNKNINNEWHNKKYHTKKRDDYLSSCKSTELDSDVAIAKQLGMTYGKYKAQQFIQQEREIRNAENRKNT